MAELEAMKRNVVKNSGGEHTMEQFLHGDDFWANHTSPTIARNHDHEEHDHPTKKSVLAKVKEKAKKLRHTLSKKKHNDNATPAWGVSLEDDYDDEDGDPEYYGAPMYESTQAPEDVKETARQHPREDVVIPDNHVLTNTTLCNEETQENKMNNNINESAKSERAPTETSKSINPITEKRAISETLNTTQPTAESFAEKLAPIETSSTSKRVPESATDKGSTLRDTMQSPKTFAETVTEKLAPAYALASEATIMVTSKIHNLALATAATLSPRGSPTDETSPSEKKYDKGVSVKEYLKHKLEPGEDERALSQVITEAISPKKESPTKEVVSKTSVVEKVRGAMSSYLAANQPSSNSPNNAHHQVVEDKKEGRVLQMN